MIIMSHSCNLRPCEKTISHRCRLNSHYFLSSAFFPMIVLLITYRSHPPQMTSENYEAIGRFAKWLLQVTNPAALPCVASCETIRSTREDNQLREPQCPGCQWQHSNLLVKFKFWSGDFGTCRCRGIQWRPCNQTCAWAVVLNDSSR